MQSLSTTPHLPSSHVDPHLSLTALQRSSSCAAASQPRSPIPSSATPSPPASQPLTPTQLASASNDPMTQASDSSASTSCCARTHGNHIYRNALRRQTSASPTFAFRPQPPAGQQAHRFGSSLANKRVLSEGEVILPRPSKKKNRMPHNPTLGKRSCGALASCSSSFVPSAPAITSWRKACEQRRQRRHEKRTHAAMAATRPAPAHLPSTTKSDVLPELRLLSATRTAPIGWSHLTGASSFMPHKVEVYDERVAKRAPERQRFWPIIDHQLDYTGARMLSLSSTSARPTLAARPLCDVAISPKSRSPLPRQQLVMPACSRSMASSDEDRSPLTPDAPTRCLASRAAPTRRASQYARDAVANESRRSSRLTLSPQATLSTVIDFTRAQASRAARNAYGQLIHSPPSPPLSAVVERPAAHAPLRIAPRRSTAADVHMSTDYFGHWETYLCNFGKESTF